MRVALQLGNTPWSNITAGSVALIPDANGVLQPVKKVAQAIADIGTSPPVACHICSDEFEEAYHHHTQVYHCTHAPVWLDGSAVSKLINITLQACDV